jgi:hypothetical protein
MNISILYHPNSEHARTVENYVRDFERIHGQPIDLVSLETREGAEMASLYGIVRYPAVLARQDNGHLLKEWQHDLLPLMDEVAAYLDR